MDNTNRPKKQELQLRSSRQAGFTLVEAVLVLALSAFFVLLALRPAGTITARVKEEIFWQQLKHAWQRETIVVPQHGVKGFIEFKAHEVAFWEGNVVKTVIKLPETMEVPAYRLIRINETGNVTANTIIVKSTLSALTYKIVVQFGWGKYYVKQ